MDNLETRDTAEFPVGGSTVDAASSGVATTLDLGEKETKGRSRALPLLLGIAAVLLLAGLVGSVYLSSRDEHDGQATGDETGGETADEAETEDEDEGKSGDTDTDTDEDVDDPVSVTEINRSIDIDSGMTFPAADGDAYEYSYRNWNNTNWGAHTAMAAGWNPTGGSRRIYIRFDLTGITTVSEALLTFPQLSVTNAALEYGVYRVTGQWDEGVGEYNSGEVEENAAPGELSWNQQPTYNPAPVTTFDMATASDASFEVDITTLVQEWLEGTTNYGLMIGINGDPSVEGTISSATSEAEDETIRPYLAIRE